MAETDPRRLAFDVLLDVERHGAYADARLARALADTILEERDRRLATLLVYGTLARQLTLDHSLSAYGSKAAADLDPEVRLALRLGLFQLAFLDRVPGWAAVDSAVRLVKERLPHASGYVNAVLRRAADKGLATPAGDDIARRSVELSHPPWLVEMWSEQLGASEADLLMDADNQGAATVLRAIGDRTSLLDSLRAEGRRVEPGRWAPAAIVCAGRPPDRAGLLAQGEASQLAVLLAGAVAGQRILDVGAAPGGKTAYLATLAGPSGEVVALDQKRGAAAEIMERVEAGSPDGRRARVVPVEGPVEEFTTDRPFDLVFVDAPCSGLGTLRQHPEIRWRLSRSDIGRLARRQAAMLAAAAAHVRPGGRLVYATCTISREENEGVLESLLAGRDELEELAGPAGGLDLAAELFDELGRFKSFPHRHGTDGFFVARLARRP